MRRRKKKREGEKNSLALIGLWIDFYSSPSHGIFTYNLQMAFRREEEEKNFLKSIFNWNRQSTISLWSGMNIAYSVKWCREGSGKGMQGKHADYQAEERRRNRERKKTFFLSYTPMSLTHSFTWFDCICRSSPISWISMAHQTDHHQDSYVENSFLKKKKRERERENLIDRIQTYAWISREWI